MSSLLDPAEHKTPPLKCIKYTKWEEDSKPIIEELLLQKYNYVTRVTRDFPLRVLNTNKIFPLGCYGNCRISETGLVVVWGNRTVEVWNLKTEKLILRLCKKNFVDPIALSPRENKWIYSNHKEEEARNGSQILYNGLFLAKFHNEISIWDLASSQRLFYFNGLFGNYATNTRIWGNYLLIISSNYASVFSVTTYTLYVCDLTQKKLLWGRSVDEQDFKNANIVNDIILLKGKDRLELIQLIDGTCLASFLYSAYNLVCEDKLILKQEEKVCIYDFNTGILLHQLEVEAEDHFRQLDKDRVVIVGKERLSIWNFNTGKCVVKYDTGGEINSYRLLLQERILINLENSALIWNYISNTIERSFPIICPDLCYALTAREYIIITLENSINIYNYLTGELFFTVWTQGDEVDPQVVLCGENSYFFIFVEGTMEIIDFQTKEHFILPAIEEVEDSEPEVIEDKYLMFKHLDRNGEEITSLWDFRKGIYLGSVKGNLH